MQLKLVFVCVFTNTQCTGLESLLKHILFIVIDLCIYTMGMQGISITNLSPLFPLNRLNVTGTSHILFLSILANRLFHKDMGMLDNLPIPDGVCWRLYKFWPVVPNWATEWCPRSSRPTPSTHQQCTSTNKKNENCVSKKSVWNIHGGGSSVQKSWGCWTYYFDCLITFLKRKSKRPVDSDVADFENVREWVKISVMGMNPHLKTQILSEL